jgi:hypothetical protein
MKMIAAIVSLAAFAACGESVDTGGTATGDSLTGDTSTSVEMSSEGPDLCFCLQTMTTDPEIAQACEALIPQDLAPAQMTALIVECREKRD